MFRDYSHFECLVVGCEVDGSQMINLVRGSSNCQPLSADCSISSKIRNFLKFLEGVTKVEVLTVQGEVSPVEVRRNDDLDEWNLITVLDLPAVILKDFSLFRRQDQREVSPALWVVEVLSPGEVPM